jgi:ATP-binding cassette subfamily B protein
MPSIEPPAAPSIAPPLPAGGSAMWRAWRRGYEAEPRLIVVSFALALCAALPDALLALWLKLLADGVEGARRGLLLAACAGLAASAVATWILRVVSDRTQRRFRDRVTIALEAHVANLQASVATIEHQERPEILDRLAVLRNQVFVLDHMYRSLFVTCGWLLRLAITVALLASIHPALALLAVFALPAVLSAGWRPAVERAAEERGAAANRLARHLFDLVTTAQPGKEVRVARLGARLAARRRTAWEGWYGPVAAARTRSAAWHALAWAVFGAAYVVATVFVSQVLRAPAGSVLLVLAAGARLSAYVSGAVGEIGFLRSTWLDGSIRLAWLEDYAAAGAESARAPVPARLATGIRCEHLSFAYPGTERLVLDDVNLDLPAGSIVAVVGENGAGKTTLVKLLCRLYRPTRGRITADGQDIAEMPHAAWRERLAGAFQDFFRFEWRARHTVGAGDLPRRDDTPAVGAAVDRAGAGDVVERLAAGLDTQLGASWPDGAELSFGQWQKLALARGFMRDRPLLLVLDEPTAALDAETEHALFERYAAAARGAAPDGRITILVSHRFSTVRMADLIVVLDGARVVESGSHESLLARNGKYADLYSIQAAAYRN